ncbi:plasmid partitioning protein RepB [Sagittula sp. S175]|uniref:plasmid partitioning protein RepB n=1 Tax=Sagittula sp. S175 TaxID=3415129 RepID=UPI003C7CBCAB
MDRLCPPAPGPSRAILLEIAPEHIHLPTEDPRLDHDPENPAKDANLRASIAAHGQQLPILVRPRPGHPGQYDLVYGRRRLRVLKSLNRPVRALVSRLDSRAAALARGAENCHRRDLSFIEKSVLAAQLGESVDRPTIAATLDTDLPTLNRMLRVGSAFDLDFLDQIGPAPGIGRDRWLRLHGFLQAPDMAERVRRRLPALAGLPDSDMRFEQVFAWAQGLPSPVIARRGPGWPNRRVSSAHGFPIGRVKVTDTAVMLTVPMGETPAFAIWINLEAERVLRDLYAQWIASKASTHQTTD